MSTWPSGYRNEMDEVYIKQNDISKIIKYIKFFTANLPIFRSLLVRIFLPQNPENVRPHSSNSIENATPS